MSQNMQKFANTVTMTFQKRVPQRNPNRTKYHSAAAWFAGRWPNQSRGFTKQVNRYVLDTESETILHIQGTPTGLHAKSTPFKDIMRLALIIGGPEAKYSIVATTKMNQDLILSKSESPLDRQATNISERSGLELIVDNRLQFE